MIGKLLLSDGREATLEDTGQWKSTDDTLVYRLTHDYNPSDVLGIDSLFPPGIGALERAASELDGKAEHTVKSVSLPDGEIS